LTAARQGATVPLIGLLKIARHNLADFLASLTAAEAAARSHADPLAAQSAWDACDGTAREDQVAGYAAAFALVAA